MKSWVTTSILLLLTVFAVGKITMPYLADSPDIETANLTFMMEKQLLNETSPTKEASKSEQNQQNYTQWSGIWNAADLIPSVQAAEGMKLSEEQSKKADGNDMMAWTKQQRALDAREKALTEREGEIVAAEERAKAKIKQLQDLESRIQALLDEEGSIKDKKIKRLTAVYEGMKAEKAAPVIAQMELEIVVKLFSRMNEKQVGKILSFMPPAQAVVISQALTKRLGSL